MSDAGRAHIVVVGNEKGGSGKSTIAIHVAVALMRRGFRVGTIDLDVRQRTLTRFFENRRNHAARHGADLLLPRHLFPEDAERDPSRRDGDGDSEIFTTAGKEPVDFIVIDTPGNDSALARLGHSYADTLITPINDSLVDFDVLASISGENWEALAPSQYSLLVAEQRKARRARDRLSIDWIVLRNRVANIRSANNERIAEILAAVAPKIGFRIAPGLTERVIYRELFLQGLTVLDLFDTGVDVHASMSHVAARQEVRELLSALWLPQVDRSETADSGAGAAGEKVRGPGSGQRLAANSFRAD